MIGAILELARQQVWALDQRVLHAFEAILLRREAGVRLNKSDIAEAMAAAGTRPSRGEQGYTLEAGGIAVVPVRGVISQRASLLDDVCPGRGTSAERISELLGKLAADSAVRAVLLDIDSPGGTVSGVPELAAELRQFSAAAQKPIWAFTDGMAASAAYWLAAATDRVLASAGAQIGSIGVYSVLHDTHRAAETDGVDVHVVASGPHKGAGTPGARLTSTQIAGVQAGVDAMFALFRDDVAADRGLSGAALEAVCDGQCWLAAQAAESGLVDEVVSRSRAIRQLRDQVQNSAADTPPKQIPVVPTAAGAAARAEGTMPQTDSITSVEQLRAAHPNLVAMMLASAEALAATAQAEAVAKAVTEERERAARILRNASSGQTQLAAELVANGAPVSDALEKLLQDPRRNAAQLLDRERASAAPAIDGAAPQGGTTIDETPEQTRKRKAAEMWAKEPKECQRIYGSIDGLEAYLAAAASGRACVGI